MKYGPICRPRIFGTDRTMEGENILGPDGKPIVQGEGLCYNRGSEPVKKSAVEKHPKQRVFKIP